MHFRYFPLSIFNCPSVLCSSAHARHNSVPNLQCKYTPTFFLQSKQNLFSSSFSLIEEEDKEGVSAFEQEFWEYTDSCIVWRMKQFRGPMCFFSIIIIIIIISLGKVSSLMVFYNSSSSYHNSTTTKKERAKEERVSSILYCSLRFEEIRK